MVSGFSVSENGASGNESGNKATCVDRCFWTVPTAYISFNGSLVMFIMRIEAREMTGKLHMRIVRSLKSTDILHTPF